jgi:hypothetical protein
MKLEIVEEQVTPPPKRYILNCSEVEMDHIYYAVFGAKLKNGSSATLRALYLDIVAHSSDRLFDSYSIATRFDLKVL